MQFVFLTLLTLVGLCIGSFCNVLIYRIPKGEEFVSTPSHCMNCDHRLAWFELIPVFSWLCLGGKCRSCKKKISAQYPLIEMLNGAMWLLTGILFYGDLITTLLYCALVSLLLVLSVIDWRTFVIPNGINLSILVLGVIRIATDYTNWSSYLIGLLAVGLVFLLLHLATGGNGLGMGDVKLVGAAGLLLGWQKMIPAILLGCILGILIHSIRMRRGAGNKLAFGPYLSAGIWCAALFGEPFIRAYLSLYGL
jgi:leader peptidase (prepilin peptidase)/N-methyltransferase